MKQAAKTALTMLLTLVVLEVLERIHPALACTVGALALGFCLGRLYNLALAPSPTVQG